MIAYGEGWGECEAKASSFTRRLVGRWKQTNERKRYETLHRHKTIPLKWMDQPTSSHLFVCEWRCLSRLCWFKCVWESVADQFRNWQIHSEGLHYSIGDHSPTQTEDAHIPATVCIVSMICDLAWRIDIGQVWIRIAGKSWTEWEKGRGERERER